LRNSPKNGIYRKQVTKKLNLPETSHHKQEKSPQGQVTNQFYLKQFTVKKPATNLDIWKQFTANFFKKFKESSPPGKFLTKKSQLDNLPRGKFIAKNT
jgi:hypothetical protein